MTFRAQILRLFTWMLHVLVCFFAIFSLVSWRFDLWIDLRWLPPLLAGFIQVLWAVTVPIACYFAGPALRGVRKPTWRNHPRSASAAAFAILPTLLMIALLLYDFFRYYQLHRSGIRYFDPPRPTPVYLVPFLSLWVLLTCSWIIVGRRNIAISGLSRFRVSVAYAWCVFAALIPAAFVLVHSTAKPPDRQVDVAVVLGNFAYPDGTCSPILRDRVLAGVDLYRRGLAKHLFLSGATHSNPGEPKYDEPSAMKNLCLSEGVPESAITLDPIGFNTRATAANTKRFMAERGYKTVAVVSSESHLPRIWLSFNALGLDCFRVPSIRGEWVTVELRAVVREWAGLLVYAINPNYRPAKGELMKLTAPRVVVTKRTNSLQLFDGSILVKTYNCITGKNDGDKEVEGDRRTPLGTFRIVYRNPQSKFRVSLGLDYPNKEDADRGLAKGLINRAQYNEILAALESDLTKEENQKRLWYSPLGGEIFIHGHAEGRSGTAGCIALSSDDIDELYAILPLGTPVEIRE